MISNCYLHGPLTNITWIDITHGNVKFDKRTQSFTKDKTRRWTPESIWVCDSGKIGTPPTCLEICMILRTHNGETTIRTTRPMDVKKKRTGPRITQVSVSRWLKKKQDNYWEVTFVYFRTWGFVPFGSEDTRVETSEELRRWNDGTPLGKERPFSRHLPLTLFKNVSGSW